MGERDGDGEGSRETERGVGGVKHKRLIEAYTEC